MPHEQGGRTSSDSLQQRGLRRPGALQRPNNVTGILLV